MNTKTLIAVVAFASLTAASCATRPPHTEHTNEVKAMLENPRTAADHAAIAAHYEEDAKALGQKAEEHKKNLSDYERHRYLYGKQYIGFKEHCENLIRAYTKATEESLEMARMHRQMAGEAK
jgi:hypothetical protein